jgi:hypothetical protein
MKEIRRRTRVVGSFPDGNSALMLVAARLRHIAGTKLGLKQYLKMNRLDEEVKEIAAQEKPDSGHLIKVRKILYTIQKCRLLIQVYDCKI